METAMSKKAGRKSRGHHRRQRGIGLATAKQFAEEGAYVSSPAAARPNWMPL